MLFQISPSTFQYHLFLSYQSAMVSSHPLYFYPSSSLSPTQLARIISLTWSAFLVLYLLIQVIEFYNLLSRRNLLRQKEGWLCDHQAVWFWWSHFLWDSFRNCKMRSGVKCHWTARDCHGGNNVEKVSTRGVQKQRFVTVSW